MFLPRQKADLEATVVQQDLLLYNPDTDRAVCLNATAAEIFRACDGSTTLEQLLARLKDHPANTDLVHLTLADFEAEGLLEEPPPPALSRREFLKRWGRVAAAASVVAAIAIPTPVHAMSCGPPPI